MNSDGLQVSVVHMSVSVQVAEMLVLTQPVSGTQVSLVHSLKSLHLSRVNGVWTQPVLVLQVEVWQKSLKQVMSTKRH